MKRCSDPFHGPTVTFHSGHTLTVTPCCAEPAESDEPKSIVDTQNTGELLPAALRLPPRL
jgi:hypothetical protein